MKKEYTNPEITITSFMQEDVITQSGLMTSSMQESFDKSIDFGAIDF